MGCLLGKVISANSRVNKIVQRKSSQYDKCSEQPTTSIQEQSLVLGEQSMNRKPIDKTQYQINEKTVSTCSQAITTLHTISNKPTSNYSMKLAEHQGIIVNNDLTRLNNINQFKNVDDTSSILTQSQDVVIFRKVLKDIFVESYISEISQDIDLNDIPNKADHSYSCVEKDSGSSASSLSNDDTELCKVNLVRITCSKSKHNSAHEEACFRDTLIDSDESYPIYRSLSSSTISNIEDSSIRQSSIDEFNTFTDNTGRMQSQQHISALNEDLHELDKTGSHFESNNQISRSNDKEIVSPYQQPTIKPLPLRITIKSDIY